MNRRHLNWGGIASVVFSFLENAERLAKLKAELLELEQPDWLENATKEVSVTMTDAEARRMAMEYREAELLYLTSAIETLRPISAKNRAAAERMAVKWFADRGVTFSKKQIENALTALQQSAELKRLGLAEWRALNPMK